MLRTSRSNLLIALAALGILGGAFAFYTSVWRTTEEFIHAVDHSTVLFGDFLCCYYPMGQQLFATRAPTYGYFYSPFFAILLSIYQFVSPRPAFLIWGFFQAVTAVLLLCLPIAYIVKKSRYHVILYVILFAFSFPVIHSLRWGQISILLMAFVLMSLYLYAKGYSILAAIVLGIGVSIKFYLGIFTVYFLIKKDTRFLITFFTTTLVCMVFIPFLALGVPDTVKFYRLVARALMEARTTWVRQNVNSQYFVHVVGRLTQLQVSIPSIRTALTLIGYLIFIFNTGIIYLLIRNKVQEEMVLAFVLLFTSIPFLVDTSWPHYFVYLPFCQIVVGRLLWQDENTVVKASTTLLFFIPSVILSSTIFFIWIDDHAVYNRFASLFFANLLMLLLTYLRVAQANRKPRSRQIMAAVA